MVAGVISLIKYAIVGGSAVACLYVTFALPVQASHGETTTINVAQKWVANLDAQVWVSWAATAGAVGYGWNERRLRRKERADKDARIKKLEEAKDPGRTSSGINQSGDPQQGTGS